MKKSLLFFMLFMSANILFAQPFTINWNSNSFQLKKAHWGINDYECLKKTTKDTFLCNYLADVDPAIIRIHWIDMPNIWSDSATKSWKKDTIKASLANYAACWPNARIILNISKWPNWMASSNAPLPDSLKNIFAGFCGKLASIIKDSLMNVPNKIDFEILNELEGLYGGTGTIAPDTNYYKLLGLITDSIKARNPLAKVGGPSLNYTHPHWRNAWVASVGNKMDFFSYHYYNHCCPTSFIGRQLMNRYDDYGTGQALYTKTQLPGKEVLLTEMNVQWNYNPLEIRHRNNEGAIWLAMNVKHKARKGIDGIMVWHAKDFYYGLLNTNNTINATGKLYEWGNKYLVGTVPNHTSYDTTKLEIIPVKHANGDYNIMILNKMDSMYQNINIAQWIPCTHGIASITQIDTNNWNGFSIPIANANNLTLNKYSITLIRTSTNLAFANNVSVAHATNFVLANTSTTFTITPSNAISYSIQPPASTTINSSTNIISVQLGSMPAGIYTITATNSNGCSGTNTITLAQLGIRISPKVFLAGCYDATTLLMYDSLRTLGLIPIAEPYSGATYSSICTHINGGGGEQTTNSILANTGVNAIVDWVLVQVRNKNNASNVVATQSALLQRDGDIVSATDGISALQFSLLPDDYFISIKHRNHCGAMTKFVQTLSLTTTFIDFTNANLPLYTMAGRNGNPAPLTGAMKTIGINRALYAGNCNIDLANAANTFITYNSTTSSDRAALYAITNGVNSIVGYSIFDVNMDGVSKFNGLNPDRSTILFTSLGSNLVIVKEQLP
jgi:hypothetical protein